MRFVSANPDVNMWSKLDARLPAVKQELAALADCAADEIALNRNSTEGLCTAIFGLPLSKGDEVLVCEWDYPSMRAAWQQRECATAFGSCRSASTSWTTTMRSWRPMHGR